METISTISDKEIKSVVIDESLIVEADEDSQPASRTAEIIAAVPGKRIVVVSIVAYKVLYTIGADFKTQWKSGTTAISGEMKHSNTAPALTLMPIPEGHFKTAVGEALNITVTDTRAGSVTQATAFIDGVITYYEE